MFWISWTFLLSIRGPSAFWFPGNFLDADLTHPLEIDETIDDEQQYHDKAKDLKR